MGNSKVQIYTVTQGCISITRDGQEICRAHRKIHRGNTVDGQWFLYTPEILALDKPYPHPTIQEFSEGPNVTRIIHNHNDLAERAERWIQNHIPTAR